MKFLSGKSKDEAAKYIEIAAKMAVKSLCLRSRCGAIIVKSGKIIGRGYNSPPRHNPKYRTCLNEYKILSGFRHDRTCCMHAEQRAVEDAIRKNSRLILGSRVYFARLVKNNQIEKGKDIKCTICSRTMLDKGVKEFIMLHEKGVVLYPLAELDRLSYQHKTPRK